MKTVAGQLRLELAQFRELAAFAQFAADLDKATRAQIDRGQRLTEILKQPQYQPMPLEQQVMIIYAATHGYLDDVPVAKVRAWEEGFHRFMASVHADIGKKIKKTLELTEEVEADLKAAIEEYQQTVGE